MVYITGDTNGQFQRKVSFNYRPFWFENGAFTDRAVPMQRGQIKKKRPCASSIALRHKAFFFPLQNGASVSSSSTKAALRSSGIGICLLQITITFSRNCPFLSCT